MEYANNMLKSDTILLALFLGNREYYCDKTIHFGISMFKDIVLNTSNSRGLASKLKEKGFTHLIIAFLLFSGWSNNVFNNAQKQIVQEMLLKNSRLKYSKGGYGVYEIQ